MDRELSREFTQIPDTTYLINEYGEVKHEYKGKVLKTFLISDYPAVNINVNGKRKTMYVHHLCALVFLGHVAKRGLITINHIDHDKTNNRLDNLEIISHRRNSALAYIHKKRELPTGVVKTELGRRKYKTQISYLGMNTYLGSYFTPEEAHAVYMEASDCIMQTGKLPERFMNRERYQRYNQS